MLSMTPYSFRRKRSRRTRWAKALAVFALLLGMLAAVVIGLYIQLNTLFHEENFVAAAPSARFSGFVQLQSAENRQAEKGNAS